MFKIGSKKSDVFEPDSELEALVMPERFSYAWMNDYGSQCVSFRRWLRFGLHFNDC